MSHPVPNGLTEVIVVIWQPWEHRRVFCIQSGHKIMQFVGDHLETKILWISYTEFLADSIDYGFQLEFIDDVLELAEDLFDFVCLPTTLFWFPQILQKQPIVFIHGFLQIGNPTGLPLLAVIHFVIELEEFPSNILVNFVMFLDL